MAAQKILIMGESGTGKSTSLRNCDPATTAVVNPVGKPLPFKNHFEMLNNETDASKIVKYMKAQAAAGKKLIVVDDFQYILSVPYFKMLNQFGWDKWNDMAYNYIQILLDGCENLSDDVIVVFMTHTETLENGVVTIKLLGKQLREKITIEGLFTTVLRTGVNEAKYYFYTQNSGKDTVKSPLGMFPAYAIENDLNYVVDKIRNYYELDGAKTDAEMDQADQAVASDLEKPDSKGRRSRTRKTEAEPEKPARKTRSEVQTENEQKMSEHMAAVGDAIEQAADGKDEVPFDEAMDAAEKVPKPDLQKPPRRTRKERNAEKTEPVQDGTTNTNSETVVLDADTYFYLPSDDNYVMKHKGDSVDLIVDGVEVMKVISKEEFQAGVKRLAQEKNPPEQHVRGQRRRRTRS